MLENFKYNDFCLYTLGRKHCKKECIRVGCIPTTAEVATRCQYQRKSAEGGSDYRGSPRGAVYLEGACLQKGVCLEGGLEGDLPNPFPCEQTDASENITLDYGNGHVSNE